MSTFCSDDACNASLKRFLYLEKEKDEDWVEKKVCVNSLKETISAIGETYASGWYVHALFLEDDRHFGLFILGGTEIQEECRSLSRREPCAAAAVVHVKTARVAQLALFPSTIFSICVGRSYARVTVGSDNDRKPVPSRKTFLGNDLDVYQRRFLEVARRNRTTHMFIVYETKKKPFSYSVTRTEIDSSNFILNLYNKYT